MSTLPDFTGPGFFAGEAPDGLTTVVSTPQPAEVRVYWRDPEDAEAEDVFVASTLSASNGTWRIDNLNPELQYVVRGRKAGFDDVTVVGATPSRTDVIAVEDHLQPTAEFDGLEGYVLMDSGLTPFSVAVIDPLPFGLSAVMDGRRLLIEGTSDDEGIWQSTVRVTASNAVTVDVPVQVVIGLKAPVVTASYAVDGDWTITLQLAGASAFAHELRVYRSMASIDVENLPVPVAVLDADFVKWVDEDVEPGQTYHYLVSAVFDGLQSLGAEVVRDAMWTPADLTQVLKIWLDDESPLVDVAGSCSQWADRSGNGLDFSQATAAARPLIVNGGLGSRRVIRFDGVNDVLVSTSATRNIFRATYAGWSLTVYKKHSNATKSASSVVLYSAAGASVDQTNRFNVIASRAANPGFGAFATRRQLTDAVAILGRSQSDVGAWLMRLDIADWQNGTVKLYANAVLDAQDTTTITAGLSSDVSGLELRLGAGSAPANSASDIDVAAVLVGNSSVPSAHEIEKLFGWAAHRYGLTANLPADHPYKLTPP